MKTTEETLELALEAFWAKVEELHPEREDASTLTGSEQYDLENYARNAVEAWLGQNKPVFYVQRTLVQVLCVEGASSAEDAEAQAASFAPSDWQNNSLDTSIEYLTLNQAP